jgi:hypothetical protein
VGAESAGIVMVNVVIGVHFGTPNESKKLSDCNRVSVAEISLMQRDREIKYKLGSVCCKKN